MNLKVFVSVILLACFCLSLSFLSSPQCHAYSSFPCCPLSLDHTNAHIFLPRSTYTFLFRRFLLVPCAASGLKFLSTPLLSNVSPDSWSETSLMVQCPGQSLGSNAPFPQMSLLSIDRDASMTALLLLCLPLTYNIIHLV